MNIERLAYDICLVLNLPETSVKNLLHLIPETERAKELLDILKKTYTEDDKKSCA